MTSNYKAGQSMRDMVRNLTDGWYGNVTPQSSGCNGPPRIRGNFGVAWSPVDYDKHIEHSIKECSK